MYVTSPNHFFGSEPILSNEAFKIEGDDMSAVRTLEAGSVLFCEGDQSDCVYEVLEGVLRTSKILCDGRRQIIAFGYPGDLIGISHDREYHNDCEAVSQVKVRVHYHNVHNADFAKSPEFCNLVLRHTITEMMICTSLRTLWSITY